MVEGEARKNKSRGFYGNYQHSLDAKGRVFVPAKYRDGLGNSFMLTRGWDHCLVAYSFDEWDKLTESLAYIPFTDREGREFKRILFQQAVECEMDKQGRILINQELRSIANLSKEVCFLGSLDYVEIWDYEEWKHKYGDADLRAESMQKYVFKGSKE